HDGHLAPGLSSTGCSASGDGSEHDTDAIAVADAGHFDPEQIRVPRETVPFLDRPPVAHHTGERDLARLVAVYLEAARAGSVLYIRVALAGSELDGQGEDRPRGHQVEQWAVGGDGLAKILELERLESCPQRRQGGAESIRLDSHGRRIVSCRCQPLTP